MGFAYIFAGVFFFGVRAAILNFKCHYIRRVKLDFGGLSFLGLRLYSSNFRATSKTNTEWRSNACALRVSARDVYRNRYMKPATLLPVVRFAQTPLLLCSYPWCSFCSRHL